MGRLRDTLGHFIRGSSSMTPPPAPQSQADGDAGQPPPAGDPGASETTPQPAVAPRRRRKAGPLEITRGYVDANGEVRRSRGGAPDSDS